jgi:MFS family permease
MVDVQTSPPRKSELKSVQEYIDELPVWSDGTNLKSPPMTAMQWRIWALAAVGKFFEGFVVFMTGVALPLIVREFHLRAASKGIAGAASLAGILVGALLLGGLSDYFGRKRMFIAEMILFCAFLALLILCTNFASLAICLFGLGMALGCDYPTAHMIISESTPSTNRGKLVIAAFGFQALGALGGTGIGCLVLVLVPSLGAWRWMFATVLIPAIIVTVGRFFVTESPSWLVVRGAHDAAEKAASQLLKREPQYPKGIRLARPTGSDKGRAKQSFFALFDDRNRRATILASIPWFLQDLSTYGIGIFTPTILAAALGGGPDHIRSLSDSITEAILAAKGSALITLLLIIGILFAVALADKLGRIRLQIFGFIGCAVGLFIASFSIGASGSAKIAIIFTGFMLFNFMTNLGPNSQTYLLAGEVFPTEVRGMGAGFAAAFAKIGAVTTAFLFPVLSSTLSNHAA